MDQICEQIVSFLIQHKIKKRKNVERVKICTGILKLDHR